MKEFNKYMAEINENIAKLDQDLKLEKRKRREAVKKRYQRQCYAVGELVIKYFPDFQNIEPGTKSENEKNFAPLAQFFDRLASDEATMKMFKECLSCTHDNQSNV